MMTKRDGSFLQCAAAHRGSDFHATAARDCGTSLEVVDEAIPHEGQHLTGQRVVGSPLGHFVLR